MKMKKVKFLSSINAKLALAAVLLAGFTFTSCEEEDLSVTSTGTGTSEVTVSLAESEGTVLTDGIAYLSVYVEATDGTSLDDATITVDDAEYTAPISYGETDGNTTVTVAASLDGYVPGSKSVYIPTISAGQCYYLTTTITLAEVGENDYETADGEITDEALAAATTYESSTTISGEYEAGVTYTTYIDVEADEVGFMDETQKEALYSLIEQLSDDNTVLSVNAKGGVSALAVANLDKAKAILKAAVLDYAEDPGTKTIKVSVIPSADCTSITISYYKTKVITDITFSCEVSGTTYAVTGNQYMYTGTTVTGAVGYTEEGTSHTGHAHGHGDETNAGGGISGE